jgi:uncharacterized protein
MLSRSLAGLLVVLFALFAVPASAQQGPTFPKLTGRVVDDANILDPAVRARLTEKLAALEQKTTTQIVVVTLPSLQGYDIADYGYRLGRAWGIGQKGSNNGAILIVAPNERAVRIEVGYGLEGTLTDAVSRLIIENAILPRFRTGDFAGGIERGTEDLIDLASGGAEEFKQRAAEKARGGAEWHDILTFIVIAFFLIMWMRRFASGARPGGGGPVIFPGGFGGGRSSGSGGGGFSGGGGSFGGGGASGRW